MTFVNYKQANLAKWQLLAWISAAATSLILEEWQGDLFPDEFPYTLKVEHYDLTSSLENKPVLKREIVNVTNKAGDTFTIERSAWVCPASDTATEQTSTAFTFESGDYVYLIKSAEDDADLKAEVARLETDKLSIADYQNGTKVYAATSVGTDSYAITLSPAITSYSVWQTFRFLSDVANTWAATLNVNGLWAKTIKKLRDQDLSSGDIEANQIVLVSYDGTNFQMDSQIATIPTVDINGETEDTGGDMDADYVHSYSASEWGNRKQKMNTYRASNAEAQAGAATNKFITPAQDNTYSESKIVASDTLRISADTERTTSSASYVKLKEIKFYWYGTVRIKFDLKRTAPTASWFGRIYKNGSAFWTQRETTSTTYVNYSEDLVFSPWDLIQLYSSANGASASAEVRNFRIYYDKTKVDWGDVVTD